MAKQKSYQIMGRLGDNYAERISEYQALQESNPVGGNLEITYVSANAES